MNITLALLLACTSLLVAVPKTESIAELKKRLAITEAALAAERTRVTALQSGTQKLTEAVVTQTREGKETVKQIEAAAGRLADAEVNGKKLADTVKSQTAAAVTETKKLREVVTTQNQAVTSAITAQVAEQKKSLFAAQQVARKLEESNKVLAKTNEENRLAKEQNAKSLENLKATLDDIQHKAAIAAALDRAAARHDWIKLIGDIATPFCGVLLALVVVFQIKASGQAKATHTMVNGQREEMQKEIQNLKSRLNHPDRAQGENI